MASTSTFVVAERWTERRTESRRWSKVKEDYQIWRYNREQFDTFLEGLQQGEHRSYYTHTKHKRFPSRIVEPNPSGEYRTVTEFTFRGQDDFIDLLISSIED